MAILIASEPPPTPVQRLLRLLSNDRKDIGYVYLYALVTGLISLSLPLGIQAVFNLVSGGLVFSSIYVLIGLIIIGVVATGLLLVGQVTLVEVLQQRVFVKAAFEFTYRLPRIHPDALAGSYPPELMNRFFDVMTIQKGLPKLLIDLTAAAVQILFGILLLSAYHPIFIGFGAFTILLIYLICRIYGPGGIKTSLSESKYKYNVVAWLEEMARDLPAHRQPGRQDSMDRMDDLVAHYVKYRNAHFRVLKRFIYSGVAFKTLVTGSLLILGTTLVVGREMSLGQFVAAELIIVLITGSVDKLTSGIDTVFDLLTAVEKIGHITDMPLTSDELVAMSDE